MQRILTILVAAVVLAFGAGSASAKPKRKVRIESDPPGATVYVGAKKAGKRGTTPVTLELAPGEQTLILELDGYLDHVESVEVVMARGKAAKTPQKVAFALDKAVGTIRLGGLPEGATVTVDGREVSTLDNKIEVDPGAHEVVVKGGKNTFDKWIEVSSGEEKKVDVALGGDDTAGGGTGGDDAGGGIEAKGTPEPEHHAAHPWYGTAGLSYEIGWRRFRYDNLTVGTQRTYDGNGVGMIDFWGELAPWRSSPGMHGLWPLSIIAGFGVGFPVTAATPSGQTADTFWRTTDLGLRWRWNVSHQAAFDFEAGWSRMLYTFRDDMNGLIADIPDVDYETVRFGLRGVAKIGKGRLWLGVEDHVVLSGGEEQDKFSGASAQGIGGRLGFDIPFMDGRVILRAEGNLQRYTWTFQSQPGDMNVADGANDTLFGFNIGLGASY